MTTLPTTKTELRKLAERMTREYVMMGGRITICPAGKHSL